jgi:hypothetical protein
MSDKSEDSLDCKFLIRYFSLSSIFNVLILFFNLLGGLGHLSAKCLVLPQLKYDYANYINMIMWLCELYKYDYVNYKLSYNYD